MALQVADSIEETILDLQEKKRSLAGGDSTADEEAVRRWDKEGAGGAVLSEFILSKKRGMEEDFEDGGEAAAEED